MGGDLGGGGRKEEEEEDEEELIRGRARLSRLLEMGLFEHSDRAVCVCVSRYYRGFCGCD